MRLRPDLTLVLASVAAAGCTQNTAPVPPVPLRIATYNIEDVRTSDLLDSEHPRLKRVANEIAQLKADILLINEIQFDGDGDPWRPEDQPHGMNGERLAQLVNQSAGPVRYKAFMAPSNTGIASGFDLNNDGVITMIVPDLPEGGVDGSPGPQTAEGRAYGNDAFGFGMFPGQYGMALLVSDRHEVLHDGVRTFQNFLWKDLPGALVPSDPDSGSPWYDDLEWGAMRLSSKSHWDIPIRLESGEVIHVLASHPTPPAFDGPEMRNKFRNHDEIRFWYEYLSGGSFLIDDLGRAGGLPEGRPFVIVGDLNADADEGSSFDNPIQKYLLDHPRVAGDYVPAASVELPDLDDDDTAWWGLRVDYVLPSTGLTILDGGVRRSTIVREEATGDHFPVWLDLIINE